MMNAGDAIADGETYLVKFYPDPAVFGTNVHPVDAGGSLDTQGKGVVTAYDTSPATSTLLWIPTARLWASATAA